MRTISKAALGAVLFGLVCFAGGCCGTGRFQVTVASDIRDADGKLQPVEVHLVGVSDNDFAFWRDRDLNDYWREPPSDKWIHRMKFGEGLSDKQDLGPSDEIWDIWRERGATWLFVIASRPPGSGGKDDLRRKWRPTWRCYWKSPYSLRQVRVEINITKSGVDIPTPTRSGAPTSPPSS